VQNNFVFILGRVVLRALVIILEILQLSRTTHTSRVHLDCLGYIVSSPMIHINLEKHNYLEHVRRHAKPNIRQHFLCVAETSLHDVTSPQHPLKVNVIGLSSLQTICNSLIFQCRVDTVCCLYPLSSSFVSSFLGLPTRGERLTQCDIFLGKAVQNDSNNTDCRYTSMTSSYCNNILLPLTYCNILLLDHGLLQYNIAPTRVYCNILQLYFTGV
jgi:hypothetical protein